METLDTPSSNRRGTDWVAARDFYLALDPPRSFETVGKHFGVSGQRVGQIARRDNWKDLADEVDAEALAAAKKRIVRTRAQRREKVLGIVDAFLDRADTELHSLDLRAADVERLAKLAELLEGEATDRISVGEVQQGFGALLTIASKWVAKKDRPAFLAEVRDSIGLLGGDG